MNEILGAALFAALFYLQLNPGKVKAKANLMIAWFIFIGALAASFLLAIGGKASVWIGGIQISAMAVSMFFMMLSIDPGAVAGMAPPQNPPQNPPQDNPPQS